MGFDITTILHNHQLGMHDPCSYDLHLNRTINSVFNVKFRSHKFLLNKYSFLLLMFAVCIFDTKSFVFVILITFSIVGVSTKK
jgi:hypothetical protein